MLRKFSSEYGECRTKCKFRKKEYMCSTPCAKFYAYYGIIWLGDKEYVKCKYPILKYLYYFIKRGLKRWFRRRIKIFIESNGRITKANPIAWTKTCKRI